MRFIVKRDTILSAITPPARAATGRNTYSNGAPSLKFELTENALTVTGNDGDLVITAEAEVNGTENGTVYLPARLVSDIVKAFEPGAVTFASTDDETTISCGRSQFVVRNLVGVELSALDAGDTDSVEIPAAEFSEGLRQVVRAALNDDSRAPQLTGVLVTQSDNGLRLVATDSYRLAIRDLAGITALDSGSDGVIIPARALSEVQRLIDGTETITFARGEYAARFVVGPVTVTTRLLKGPFPDYERLIPESYPVEFTTDRAHFADALKRMRVVTANAKDGTTPVRLEFDGNGVALTVKTAETGTASDRVDGTLKGDPTGVIGFNVSFLLDALDAIVGESITFEVIDQSKPATLRGDDASFSHLIMPVRVI